MVHLLKGNEKDIVVFGDGLNDISMIDQAPLGIAMGNAIDEVKAVANFITKEMMMTVLNMLVVILAGLIKQNRLY